MPEVSFSPGPDEPSEGDLEAARDVLKARMQMDGVSGEPSAGAVADYARRLIGNRLGQIDEPGTTTDNSLMLEVMTKMGIDVTDSGLTHGERGEALRKLIVSYEKKGRGVMSMVAEFVQTRSASIKSKAEKQGVAELELARAFLVGELAERLSCLTSLFEAKTVVGSERLALLMDSLAADVPMNLAGQGYSGAKEISLEQNRLRLVPTHELVGRKTDPEVLWLLIHHVLTRKNDDRKLMGGNSPWKNEEEYKLFLDRIKPPDDKKERARWHSPITHNGERFVANLPRSQAGHPVIVEMLRVLNETTMPDAVVVSQIARPADDRMAEAAKILRGVNEQMRRLDCLAGRGKLFRWDEVEQRFVMNKELLRNDVRKVIDEYETETGRVKDLEVKAGIVLGKLEELNSRRERVVFGEKEILWPVEVKGWTEKEWEETREHAEFIDGDLVVTSGRITLPLAIGTELAWLGSIVPDDKYSHGYLLRVLADAPDGSLGELAARAGKEVDGVEMVIQKLALSRGDLDFLAEALLSGKDLERWLHPEKSQLGK